MKFSCLTKSRKALALMAVLLLLAALTGCKKDTPETTGGTEPPAPSTDISTEAPTETESAPTDAPVETTVPPTTQAPTQAPTEAPTEPPTEAPTEAPTEPPATEPEPVIGIVYTTKLNIREEPGTAYRLVGTYYSGEKVEILETKNGWGRTDRGWVSMEYINIEKKPSTQDSANGEDKESIVGNGAAEILGYGVCPLEQLNVRSGPGTGYKKIDTITKNTRHAYYQKETGWVRIDAGWVSTSYFYVEGTTDVGAATGTVHSANPNIRVGPGLEYDVVGSYKNGDVVKILAQINNWGYTEKGWVNMNYVGVVQKPTGMGTVNTETLNIRSQAKVDSTQVGTYSLGDRVEILETNGNWGRTDKGWVSLDYITMDI